MQKKRNLWMADWEDEIGRRIRMGFKTKARALAHQTRQRKISPKKAYTRTS
jgi:hypothetical protein